MACPERVPSGPVATACSAGQGRGPRRYPWARVARRITCTTCTKGTKCHPAPLVRASRCEAGWPGVGGGTESSCDNDPFPLDFFHWREAAIGRIFTSFGTTARAPNKHTARLSPEIDVNFALAQKVVSPPLSRAGRSGCAGFTSRSGVSLHHGADRGRCAGRGRKGCQRERAGKGCK